MKFKVNSARELYWTEDFARQNGFSFHHGYWPSTAVFYFSNKQLIWFGPSKTEYPSIVDFIRKLDKKEVMIYEDGLLAGPFKAGDITPYIGLKVKVVNTGFLYSSYDKWFNSYPSLAARYMYLNHGEDILGDVGTIVAMGPHENFRDSMIYAVEFDDGFNKPIFLMKREAFVVEETQNEVLD